MKYARIIYLIALVITSVFLSHAFAAEDSVVRYELTPQKLMAARILVVSSPDFPKYFVTAELNFEDLDVFRRLTKENIGKKHEVSFNGKVLMSAVIEAEIPNGTINVLRTNDKEEALKLVRELLP